MRATSSRTYTIDASVFLNAFNASETGHEQSYQFLELVRGEGASMVVPTLLLPEAAATIVRGRGDAALARSFAAALARLPSLILVPLDAGLAQQAVDVAAEHRLRGSDAVYAAVALRFGSLLVTLDREQRERVTSAIVARYPAEVLAERPE